MFRFNDGRDWFLRRRLGLFLHWGLYAINGIQEQEQQRQCHQAHPPQRTAAVCFHADASSPVKCVLHFTG